MGLIQKRLCRDTLKEVNLSRGCVIQRQIDTGRDFEIHKSVDDFHTFFLSNYAQIACGMMALNEVIHGDVPQKLKLDLDIDADNLGEVSPHDLIAHLKETTQKVSLELFGEKLDSSRWTLFRSHSTRKVSYHLVGLRDCVPNCLVAKEFATRLASESEVLANFLDTGVYKSVQFFRVLGTSKMQSELRFKQEVQRPWEDTSSHFERTHQPADLPTRVALADSQVAYSKDLPKQRLCLPPAADNPPRCSRVEYPACPALHTLGDSSSLLQCCERAMERASSMHRKAFNYSVEDTSVRLFRKTSSLCLIHRRIHNSDNCIIYVNPSARDDRHSDGLQEYCLTLRCFRGLRDGHVALGNVMLRGGRWELLESAASDVPKQQAANDTHHPSVNRCTTGKPGRSISLWRRKALKPFAFE